MTAVQLKTGIDWLTQELSDVIRLFLGDVTISDAPGDMRIDHAHSEKNGEWIEYVSDGTFGFARHVAPTDDALEAKRRIKRAAKNCLFELMRTRFRFSPPWGSLTGIRPTRLIYEAMEQGQSLDEAVNRLTDEFFVSPEKAHLLKDIVTMQQGCIDPPEDTFDLYIHIPFCVSRCAYCSFASLTVGKGALLEPYTQAVIKELKASAEMMNALGLRIRAGYVGGGTPTAIKCEQLERILACAMELFPGAVEWTVEAGRPDTIDREKLSMLKRMRVERISVNPQSFSDETLKRIGRAHSAEDTLRAYALAREMDFHHINMDLIAALPGEGVSEFRDTLGKVNELRPESVTVHSLAIKRSSRPHEQLTVAGDSHNQANAEGADEMITLARTLLTGAGYRPYYLYRQKYMAGNLENVGYALPGYQCLYNIGNMEETQRVLAVGAGAITKWLFKRERRIERAANLRNVEEYIQRVDEMAERKRGVIFAYAPSEGRSALD